MKLDPSRNGTLEIKPRLWAEDEHDRTHTLSSSRVAQVFVPAKKFPRVCENYIFTFQSSMHVSKEQAPGMEITEIDKED